LKIKAHKNFCLSVLAIEIVVSVAKGEGKMFASWAGLKATSSKPASGATLLGNPQELGRIERVFSSQTMATDEGPREQLSRRQVEEWEEHLAREFEEALAIRDQMDTRSTDEGLAQLARWQADFELALQQTGSGAVNAEPKTWIDRLKRVPAAIAKQFRRLMVSTPTSSPSASRETSRA
jgi:hypothetical protein